MRSCGVVSICEIAVTIIQTIIMILGSLASRQPQIV